MDVVRREVGAHRLFDRYVIVDWSAHSSPKRGRDSIWIAVVDGSGSVAHLSNPSTRHIAIEQIGRLLGDADERVLIGWDFSFGYPAPFASALTGRRGAAWSDVWRWFHDEVTDEANNANDRFIGARRLNQSLAAAGHGRPFWGFPGNMSISGVPRTRPQNYGSFDEFRLTEHRVRSHGHRPFSSWQLAYPGSVGSQMMLGMHWLMKVKGDDMWNRPIQIWPFETGIGPGSGVVPKGTVLCAEVWPSMFHIDRSRHEVTDAAQVLSVANHLAQVDLSGELEKWFDPALTDRERRVVLREEGWTLGVV